jgi:hypothetical protein
MKHDAHIFLHEYRGVKHYLLRWACITEGYLKYYDDTTHCHEQGIPWPSAPSIGSSFGITMSRWYSEIDFCQSRLELDVLVIVAISDPGSCAWLVCPDGVPVSVPGDGAGLPSPDGVPSGGAGLSSSSWMDDLMRPCTNTPGGGYSQVDPSWARASAASLSRQRIWLSYPILR